MTWRNAEQGETEIGLDIYSILRHPSVVRVPAQTALPAGFHRLLLSLVRLASEKHWPGAFICCGWLSYGLSIERASAIVNGSSDPAATHLPNESLRPLSSLPVKAIASGVISTGLFSARHESRAKRPRSLALATPPIACASTTRVLSCSTSSALVKRGS